MRDFEKVRLLLRQDRLIAPLKDVPHPLVDPVEALRVHAVELAHAFAEIPIRRLDKKMVMVGHQAVGVDDLVKPSPHAREHFQKDPPVTDGPKNVLPSITARGDVVERTGKLELQRSGHDRKGRQERHKSRPDPGAVMTPAPSLKSSVCR
jgi:hypothetical protein